MTAALAWLRPREPTPLTRVPQHAARLLGSRYDGLLTPTIGGAAVAVDLLTCPDGRAATLVDAVPAGAAVARRAAAWVHTGHACPKRLVLVVPPGGPRHQYLGQVHRQEIGPEDVMQLAGVAVTTPVRTVVDLLRFDGSGRATAAVRALLAAGLDPQAVRERLALAGRSSSTRAHLRLDALLS